MNTKYSIVGVVAVVVVVLGIVFAIKGINSRSSNPVANEPSTSSVVNGKQIIDITAKGGYSPKVITAKANTSTVIRISTNSSFDCSSSVSIPSLGYKTNLPPTGKTDIPVPAQKPGTSLQGLCAMGMYNFEIKFN